MHLDNAGRISCLLIITLLCGFLLPKYWTPLPMPDRDSPCPTVTPAAAACEGPGAEDAGGRSKLRCSVPCAVVPDELRFHLKIRVAERPEANFPALRSHDERPPLPPPKA